MNNQVKTEVERQLARQMDKGVRKYGHGIILDDGKDWLQEAIEECVDQLQYLCAAKLERDNVKHDASGYVDTSDGLMFIEGVTYGKTSVFTSDTIRVPTNHELHGLD